MHIILIKKIFFTYVLFYGLWVYAQPSDQLQLRIDDFCTNNMSDIVQNTQNCIQEIDKFVQETKKQRRENEITFIRWTTGFLPPPRHFMHNEIKNKAIAFCTNNQSPNTMSNIDHCTKNVREFVHFEMRLTQKHNGMFTTASDITREYSFMDPSTWNPSFVDFNLPQFYSYIENTEYCIQDINTLSNKMTHTMNQISTSNIKLICENLDTFNGYAKCLNVKKDVILSIKSLIQSAQNVLCSNNAYLNSMIRELQSILQPLQNEYEMLSEARSLIFAHHRALQEEQINKEIVNESRSTICEIDIRNAYESIIAEFTIHNFYTVNGNLYPIEQGDLYKLNRGMDKCRILSEKILSLSEICNLQHLPLIEDVQQMMTQFESNFENPNIFDQTIKYTCEKLRQSDPGVNLCENPVNNPSWIYSAHYFLEESIKDK